MIKRLILVGAILTIIAWLCAWPYFIDGDCMAPAVKDKSWVLVSRIRPYIRPFQRGDIIAFWHEEKAWIARIVALENDTIQIFDRRISINGQDLSDSAIHRNWENWKQGSYGIEAPLCVQPGHVFVLSDNLSAQHDDSRVFGPISRKQIIGTVRENSVRYGCYVVRLIEPRTLSSE